MTDQAPDAVPQHANPCAFCTKAASNFCNGCKNIRYCSTSCQTEDWSVHKLVCKKFKDFSSPPAPGYFRAILFPEDAPRPCFAWVQSRRNPDLTLNNTHVVTDLQCPGTTLKDEPRDLQVLPSRDFDVDFILRRKLQRIVIIVDLRALKLRSKPTRSVESVDPRLTQVFQGPILFIGYENRHLDTYDLRYIVDHMLRILYNQNDMENMGMEKEEHVQGVKICCKGDVEIAAQPQYKPHAFPRRLLADESLRVTLGDKIGIPLVMYVFPPSTF
jgi:hypothetical protein